MYVYVCAYIYIYMSVAILAQVGLWLSGCGSARGGPVGLFRRAESARDALKVLAASREVFL